MGDVGKLIGAPTLKIVFVVLLLYLGLLENILLASFTGIRDSIHCKMPFGYMIYTANSHEFRLSSTQWLALNSRHHAWCGGAHHNTDRHYQALISWRHVGNVGSL